VAAWHLVFETPPYYIYIDTNSCIWINKCAKFRIKYANLQHLQSACSSWSQVTFSRYHFQDFAPDPDWIETIGTVEGAINRELEVRLGTRANGPIEFVERGPSVEALVDGGCS
jgi:hypothetical protein